MREVLYQCPHCGLHYKDEAIAKTCASFCLEHNGCSLEITQYSEEVKKLVRKRIYES